MFQSPPSGWFSCVFCLDIKICSCPDGEFLHWKLGSVWEEVHTLLVTVFFSHLFVLQQKVTKIPGSPDPNIPEWDWGDDSTSSTTTTTATSTAATKGKDAVEGKVSVCGWIVMAMFPLWQISRVQFKWWCRNTQVSGVCVAVSVSAQEWVLAWGVGGGGPFLCGCKCAYLTH